MRHPTADRFRLSGNMSQAYRVKCDGVTFEHLVIGTTVRVICIALVADNPCDAIHAFNQLIRSGNDQKLLHDLGFPESLVNTDLSELSQLPQ
jgi:hypothetical protein